VQFEIHGTRVAIKALWDTVDMAEKRTKADKAQRQADQLEKKTDRRPAQSGKKRPPKA
jgi:hypothetical protein